MTLVEKVTQEDLILYEVLKNPVLATEFINNYDKSPKDKPFELDLYQQEMMCDFNPYVSLCCGRSIGKTVTISSLIIWYLIFKIFEEYICYSVPNKVHLEPVFSNLVRMFRSNSLLKMFIRPTSGINGSDNTIELLNGTKLLCRIAGTSGTGANVIGLHTPVFFVDEAGYYPYGAWTELQPTINTFIEGFKLMVSGVPTGLREKNVLYSCDMESSQFTKHRISALENPRFSKDDELKAREQYGGTESDDYIHLVLGKHGKPIFALFDRTNFEIGTNPVYRISLNGLENMDDATFFLRKIDLLPNIPDKKAKTVIGIDLGYTEPTAIFVMYINNIGQLIFHAKIRLDKVSYPMQERLIDALDSKFNPLVIGIDEGNAGKHVVQTLMIHDDFKDKKYKDRLQPIDFSSATVIGINNDGEELKQKTKPFAVTLLQDYSNNHKVVYTSTDIETIVELERMTYTIGGNGDYVYKTLTVRGGKRGEDHFTSALLCAVMAYYLKAEFILMKPRKQTLVGFSWLGR